MILSKIVFRGYRNDFEHLFFGANFKGLFISLLHFHLFPETNFAWTSKKRRVDLFFNRICSFFDVSSNILQRWYSWTNTWCKTNLLNMYLLANFKRRLLQKGLRANLSLNLLTIVSSCLTFQFNLIPFFWKSVLF